MGNRFRDRRITDRTRVAHSDRRGSFTRVCPAIEVDTSLSSRRVTRALDWVVSQRGRPEVLHCNLNLPAETF